MLSTLKVNQAMLIDHDDDVNHNDDIDDNDNMNEL